MRVAPTGLRTWRVVLSATGVHASLLPLALAAVVTVVWHDGMIRTFGPLSLAAPLPVVVAVPTLLAVPLAASPTSLLARRSSRRTAGRSRHVPSPT